MGPVLGLSEKVPEGELLPPGPGPSCSAGISVGEAASPAVGRTQWEQGGRAAAQDPSAVQPWPSFTSFTSGGGEGCGLLVTLGLSGAPWGWPAASHPLPARPPHSGHRRSARRSPGAHCSSPTSASARRPPGCLASFPGFLAGARPVAALVRGLRALLLAAHASSASSKPIFL